MRDQPWAGPQTARQAQKLFVGLFVAIVAIKLLVAARLPLFVDEAFYWQEGQHLAAAYSDLPGLTAWLIRIGVSLGGDNAFALRLPFLLIAAAVPWLVVGLTRREFGEVYGWQAGCFALLLPLSGTLGVMALPDAAMTLATLLCVDAGARLLQRIDAAAALELAAGLVIGALSHYRFIAVIGVGVIALLLMPEGRRALRDVRVWTAIAIGASAWMPLIGWNLDNADAGLRFQLVDRHPWAFHVDGLWFIAIQALMVTPLLFAALMLSAWRGKRSAFPASRYFALLGGLLVAGFFLLGFFADTERVSFHWPLPGYIALLPLLPATIAAWPPWWRRATWALAGVGLVATLGYFAAVSIPEIRARSAATKWYASNFAGWDELANAVRGELVAMPPGTRVVAGNFKIGAELGFALDDARIEVLDHPLNHKHGRAPQLALWGLLSQGRAGWDGAPTLLVLGLSDVPYKDLLSRFHAVCEMVGPLPAPRILNVDHGRQRFALFRLDAAATGPCTTPAMAWVDWPTSGASVGRRFTVSGWAFKDGTGLDRVELLLDGAVVSRASYGIENPGVAKFWRMSTDPNQPRVGFSAEVDASAVASGRHWLGLRLHGSDGSIEDWAEQPIEIE